ncbi:hypothetical protein NEPAR06_2154 [Nematocida parisii]|uniref:Uncharacterized protein n=1 Tax=Nematocida parisii (strain ERTm3) TaxID=935791 RepID=I3EJN7_NEMP3|nr:uncharacterized protein NEPG_01041 [Nematocida parisii ERTm1]EIJ89434.1 hypothetical protein NEQG_00204 [Nematocida parisii ERTm3]KAI5129832.1 hypothetical protein NEPAR03_1837 [Nematocida parisii]EIJ94372.1 hypothetical protein NEPG_01041 [Nematocida parisii ERTm1]KAI5130725.1 hypothetical protein NEPAR08_2190 [Nematocida parisii]KAI5143567.1 hypothetical protein NEPAR04_1894 [Nematocida parisii]|eukprot:XP_013058869.1 hypothetical protein NEPG_01041 [Nematocida parisii ERTm1]
MLNDAAKDKQDISTLIKELSERKRKRKEISANLQGPAKSKDIFDEKIKLDHVFGERPSKGIFQKAWSRMQGIWKS